MFSPLDTFNKGETMEGKTIEDNISELATDVEKAMKLCTFSCCNFCDYNSMPPIICECHLIARELLKKYQLKK